jgi:hypothetical protein
MRSDRHFDPAHPHRFGSKGHLGIALVLALLLPGCRHNAPPPEEAKSLGPDGQPIHAQGRGESAASHISVQGDYQVDQDALSFCTLNADKAFQVTWRAVVPEVVLRIENFHGAGDYPAEVRVRSTYTGEAYRTSKAVTKVTIQVAAGAGGAPGALVSGSFHTPFSGESGKGTVSGSFERCPYVLEDTAL